MQNTLWQSCEVKEDRRRFVAENGVFYDRLTLAQKIAAAEISQFGFRLLFIRGKSITALAIFFNQEQIVTVDIYGIVAVANHIKIRL